MLLRNSGTQPQSPGGEHPAKLEVMKVCLGRTRSKLQVPENKKRHQLRVVRDYLGGLYVPWKAQPAIAMPTVRLLTCEAARDACYV